MADALTRMIFSGIETEVYDLWSERKGNSVTKMLKCGEVTCSVNPAHVRGHMFQRPRFTWALNGKRIAKSELLKMIEEAR